MYELRAKSPGRAKPGQPQRPGELLTTHSLKTLKVLRRIRARVGRIPGLPDEFWTWAELAALLHDTGKFPYGFQRQIANTDEPPTVWGQRHEVLSLGFVSLLLNDYPERDRVWVASAVAGHHRAFTGGSNARKLPVFTQYGDDNATTFTTKFFPAENDHLIRLCRWLHDTARHYGLPVDDSITEVTIDELAARAHAVLEKLIDRWEWPLRNGDSDGRTAVLLLGALTMADHLSSAPGAYLHTRQPLTADYPGQLIERLTHDGYALRPQQQNAHDTRGHLLLRSWTASGKTEASLLWARTQISELTKSSESIPRVFYVLPYLASINAMTNRLTKELDTRDGIGVAHSKAASYHLAHSLADDTDEHDNDAVAAARKARSRAQATKNFRELLRVGTPYQLLRGALAGPVHSSILLDSANSVFILDELHAFDTRRLGLILAMMRFWEQIGGRIAVLSATLPTRLTDLVTNTLEQPLRLVTPPAETAAPARHRIHTRPSRLTDPQSIDEIRDQLTAGRSVLVVANNIKDAITLYRDLAPSCIEPHGSDSAFLLHSRFRRCDRTTIERRILDRFEVGKQRQPGLLVGTQALEVSLNIDLDMCYTSAANLEALLQRFGRANRIGALPPVPVTVHQPHYRQRGQNKTLWADGVYEETPTRLAWDILCRHEGEVINENTTTAWLDEIYATSWGERWRIDVERHRDDFQRGFLSFRHPFDDRSALTDRFDQLFEGTEAILSTDRADYEKALNSSEDRATGKLLADEFLIPMPYWAEKHTQPASDLNVRTINGKYDRELGLLAVDGPSRQTYRLDESE
ncbi:CRISPR-associated helicase/endonuclease Cas3 [Nocardia amamiensis]|uniref:CRISPR-associated helicase/endonuclease Cas3 n=1 Tax=Nocardia amamiensis TaxID=404578 RepID=UPI00082E4CBA|nr:CRISPR-associated helicase/endonuclease Cas3 [Nocardia amamiensis]